jgi:hypothetical protein
MNVGGTFAVDALNLMWAFRATHADVSLADIDRLPITGLIDLGVDVIAHLTRNNSWMARVHIKCVFRAWCSGPNAFVRYLGLLDCEMAVVLPNYIIPACSLLVSDLLADKAARRWGPLCLAAFSHLLRRGRTLWTAKASSFAPPFNFSRSQIGIAPLPAHVWPNLSRYLTASLLQWASFVLLSGTDFLAKPRKLVLQLIGLAAKNLPDVISKLEERIEGHRGKIAFGHFLRPTKYLHSLLLQQRMNSMVNKRKRVYATLVIASGCLYSVNVRALHPIGSPVLTWELLRCGEAMRPLTTLAQSFEGEAPIQRY